jgi:pSer/pThr/pTyr-binding forkhead associated (FHA) protein
MTEITLRILDGADRGRVYEGLTTPVTIGREEGNTIQINDERISRFHAKIQEDHDKVVLTDLESTNGTKVNGEDIQLRILRYGDMIAMGRSVLLFGSREQIAQRIGEVGNGATGSRDNRGGGLLLPDDGGSSDFNWNLDENPELQAALQSHDPPDLPERLSPAQAAQLAELIEYVHIDIRDLIATVEVNARSDVVTLDFAQWQNLLELQDQLARYHRSIGDPDV